MIKGETRIGSVLAYLYVGIPVFIFCVSWTKIFYAIVFGIILCISFAYMLKNAPRLPLFDVNLDVLITIVLFVGAWVYLSGIGGYVFQNPDHPYRNAIFVALVENDWPVVKEVLTESGLQTRGLTYYIGFWMPAALVGKLFGLDVGYFFQYIWAVAGVLLTYYLICCILKKMTVWPLIVFAFFGGLDILGTYATGGDIGVITEWKHLESWTKLQFSSFCVQLFWVFNQAIPAWIITLMLYLQKDNKNTLFLWSMGMLNCTIPFVGMIPIMFYFSVRNEISNFSVQLDVKYKNIHAKMREIRGFISGFLKGFLTLQNIVGALCVALVMLVYLAGNTAVVNTVQEEDVPTKFTLMRWFSSILYEVVIYYWVVKKYQMKNPLYYVSLFWLMICPFIRVGSSYDFCMRASIPALLILYILVVQTLETAHLKKDKVSVYLLTALLCISSVTGIFEINRSITNTLDGDFHRDTLSEDVILTGDNFSSDVDSNFFYKYIAKSK